jgi:mannitol/fructose-specific phosphotransferase system IIA component (Ntr-type)
MDNKKIVEVQYHDPERDDIVFAIGVPQEGSHHLLLISEIAEGLDLYSYSIIPRDSIKKIVKLEPK